MEVTLNKDEYLKGAIAEVLRVNKLRPNFTYLDYQDLSTFPYKGDQIRDRTGLKLNDIKIKAGLTIRTQRGIGSNNKTKGRHRYTERICNMDGCDKTFKALDHMRSCEVCTNTKRYGDSSAAGFDEFNTGCIGGINK
jgi:hypothetical protein